MLKTFVAGMALLAMANASVAATITGAGASFPKLVYAKWAESYQTQTGNQLNYQAIGSGAGIKQIEAGTVDFGASDKPLKPDQLQANGLQQFPTVIGGIVPVVNIPGVAPGQLRLSGPLLADIYRGIITNWNHPNIAALNPGVKLPNMSITVVHRADGSGTTFLFTSFLSLQAPHWASGPGASDSVNWPVGVGGKGNDGVAVEVQQTKGSIGYVEYAYAKQNHLAYALMQNKAHHWVSPTAAAFAAAAAGAQWQAAPGFYLLLLDQPGSNSWPITGATFILLHKKQTNAQTGHGVLAFYDWAYKAGDAQAAALDYVPLPASVKTLIRKSWAGITGPDGKPVYR